MAIVQFGPGVADMRGSVGGITYSKSYAGPVVKLKSSPPRRARRTQPINRSILGFLSRQWGELTNAQRDSWETWALNHPEPDKFGGTFIMSGINAFVKLNSHAIRLGGVGAWNVLPPSVPPAANLLTLAVTQGATNAGEIDVNWTLDGTGDAADFAEIQIAGPFQSEALQEVFNQFRYFTQTVGNILTSTPSGLDEGFWYWVRVRYVDLYGQVTAWLYGQATPKLTI